MTAPIERSRQTCLKLADICKTLGITQIVLAEHLGISQPTVSAVLSGKSDPKLSTLLRYLDAVNALSPRDGAADYALRDL